MVVSDKTFQGGSRWILTPSVKPSAPGWTRTAEEMVADLQSFTRIRSVSRADLAAPGAPFGPECREMLDFALDHARKDGL